MGTSAICPTCGKTLPRGTPKERCPECLLRAGLPTESPTGPDSSQSSFVPPSLEQLAATFPQLEILELLGRGGMGAVYKVRQKELDRVVALKILPPGVGDDPAFCGRFVHEAKALAKLNHPNIVTLHEFHHSDGLFYFIMEYVDGVNLRQLLNAGRLAPREALAIVPQICDALQYAHDQGVVHRDIKPENILLDRKGRVKVADFGLARLMGITGEPSSRSGSARSASFTEAGKVMGTPQYMAPEQRERPGEVDHRADIYSLGLVFYQMLTGELPDKKIEPPSKKVLLDVRLDEVVLRALEKEPDRRYQQASLLKTQIETIATDTGSANFPPTALAAEQRVKEANSLVTSQTTTASQLLRLALLVVATFALTETAIQVTGHWREADQEQWFVPFAFYAIMASLWLARPFFRKPRSLLKAIIGSGAALLGCVILYLASDFYGNFLVPRFVHPKMRDEMEASFGRTPSNISRSANPKIENVVVSTDKAMVKQRQFNGEGLLISFGALTNRWEPRHVDSLFAVSLETPMFRRLGRGANWVVRRAHGPMGYNVESPTGTITGEIVFNQGTPAPEADGSYFIGQFQPNKGQPLPIAVKLVNEASWVDRASEPSNSSEKPGKTQITESKQRPDAITSAEASFGPALERVLPDADEMRGYEALDLLNGKFLSFPFQAPKDGDWLPPWLETNRVDLIATIGESNRWYLMCVKTKLSDFDTDSWARATPGDSAAALQSGTSLQPIDDNSMDEATTRAGVMIYRLPPGTQLPRSFAFQTREGVQGLLQLTGFTEEPRGLAIRYKLAQNSTTKVADTRSAAVPLQTAAAFGPVLERVLPFGLPCAMKYFQFRTGNVIPIGNGPGDKSDHSEEYRQAEESGGLDASAIGTEDGIQFAGRGCIFVPVQKSNDWETLTVEKVVQTLRYETWLKGVVEVYQKDFPATYLFKTSQGECGILQIPGVTDEKPQPSGVKLRYKLVQGGTRADANAQPPNSTTTTKPTAPDYMKALAVFQAMTKEGDSDLDEALERKDLQSAQTIVSRFLEEVQTFNKLVQDPAIGFSRSFVEILAKGADALKAGDLEGAQRLFNTVTNQDIVSDNMFGQLLALANEQRLARATNPVALAAYAASGLTFGPVMERVVNDLDRNVTNSFLDLDFGDFSEEVFPVGVTSAAAGRRALNFIKPAIPLSGVDVLGDAREHGLKVFNLITVPADNWLFDALTPAALVTNAQLNLEPERHDGLLSAKKPPGTWLFNTREGGVGILQITGFTDKPRGVKIRYKLVQSAR